MLGAAPVVGQLLVAGTVPLQTGVPVATSPAKRLHHLIGPVLREFLGVSYGHDAGGLPRPAQYAAVLAFLAAYVVALWRRRAGLRTFLQHKGSRRRPVDLVLLVPPIVMVSYAASPSAWYVGTPRYLLVAYPVLALGVVAAAPRLRPAPAVAGAVASTLAAGALTLGFFGTQSVSWAAQEPELRQVIAVLEARHEPAVFADYWTAMPLLYLSDGQVPVGVSSGTSRFPDQQRAALAAAAPSYVVGTADGSAERLTAALAVRHVTFRTTRIGRLVIVDQLSARVEPADLR